MKPTMVIFITMLFVSSNLCAEVRISEDWAWDITGTEFFYAATVNSEGRIFGQYCYHEEGACYYLVNLGVICKENDEYPALLNSDAGATSVTLICGHSFDNSNVFYIKPFDEANRITLQAQQIGFAIAMEKGTFKVVRFSLSGSTHAIKMVTSAAELLYRTKSDSKLNRKKPASEQYL